MLFTTYYIGTASEACTPTKSTMTNSTRGNHHAKTWNFTLIWAVIFANIGLLLVGLLFTRLCVSVTRVPDSFVACSIITLCVIGSFAINNSLFEVGLMLGFGLFGYWMKKAGVSPAPMVIGLILGPVMETSYQQSMLIGQGNLSIFLTSPIAVVLLSIAAFSVLQATPFFGWLRGALRDKAQAE
jgi:putative tricarboxylic transport membrane protein